MHLIVNSIEIYSIYAGAYFEFRDMRFPWRIACVQYIRATNPPYDMIWQWKGYDNPRIGQVSKPVVDANGVSKIKVVIAHEREVLVELSSDGTVEVF